MYYLMCTFPFCFVWAVPSISKHPTLMGIVSLISQLKECIRRAGEGDCLGQVWERSLKRDKA